MTTVEKDAILHSLDNLLIEIASCLRRDRYKIPVFDVVETRISHDHHDKFTKHADRLYKSALSKSVDTRIPETFVIDDKELDDIREFAQDFIL